MAATQVYLNSADPVQSRLELQEERRQLLRQFEDLPVPTTAEEMLALEQRVMSLANRLGDTFVAERILAAHADDGVRRCAFDRFCKSGGSTGTEPVSYRSKGRERVSVFLPGGTSLSFESPYQRRIVPRSGPKRRTGNRGPGGSGEFPVLRQLGLSGGASPLATSRIARATLLCSSYQEAVEELARDGIEIDKTTAASITIRTGKDLLHLRELALTWARLAPLTDHGAVTGQRLRVSIDGGRTRIREAFTEPKVDGKRRKMNVDWREPRMITIDVLNADGQIDRDWAPIYEVTFGDADECMQLLVGLLRHLGAHLASEVIFVADGAEWIWNRVDGALDEAGIDPERRHCVVDFYHACEHITKALAECGNMTAEEHYEFGRQMRRDLLEPNGVDTVITKLTELARGRRARKMKKHIKYFRRHRQRMRYANLRSANRPIGSGVVESAIRQVVNLRFKSAGQVWRVENVLPLMELRALLKAGHWDTFLSSVLKETFWLPRQPWCRSTEDNVKKAA